MRKEGQNHRLKGWFYPSSRPPNGLPPCSCVIYVKRALACFCLRQHSAFSRDPLSLPQPARHHRVEINKGSPGRVRAVRLKWKKKRREKNVVEGRGIWGAWITALKRGLFALSWSNFTFIFRKLVPLIIGCYLKTAMGHERHGKGDFKC